MFDEAENQKLPHDSKLRAIIDAAYENDGCIDLVDKEGNPVKFHVFAPVLWALRGSTSDVPMSMLSRAFIIAMRRSTPRIRLEKHYFEDHDFIAVRTQAGNWAANVQLGPDPKIPAELRRDPRLADNCRPLLAIADNLNRGAEARAAPISQRSSGVLGRYLATDAQSDWAARARRSLKFCEIQLQYCLSPRSSK